MTFTIRPNSLRVKGEVGADGGQGNLSHGQPPLIQVAAEKPGWKLVKNRFFTKVCAIMFPTRRVAGEPRGVSGDKPGGESLLSADFRRVRT
jgi:hypothetical protein